MQRIYTLLVASVALVASVNVAASGNPFDSAPQMAERVQLAGNAMMEGKCGGDESAKCGGDKSGKCGGGDEAGKCGGDKAAKCGGEMAGKCGGDKTISVLKGKCGDGKCGSARVRNMMDRNGDGMIDRAEYRDWAVQQADAEFDKMAGGAETVSPDAAFKSFLEFEALSDF